MPDFTIYRSSHPDVLAVWSRVMVERDAYNERLTAQMAAWGFDHTKVLVSNSAFRRPTFLAVEHYGMPPEGWRYDGKYSGRIVPYRKNKQLAAEFDALRDIPSLRQAYVPLGMPEHMFSGLSVTTYACIRHDDVVWVKWHEVDPLASDQWWTKVPLSMYYAMVESNQDPFAVKDEDKEEAGA